MAWRTCGALGCSDCCNADANRASARAELMLRWFLVADIAGLLGLVFSNYIT
jgi:hypothetical protein